MPHYDLDLHFTAGPPLHAEAVPGADHFQASTRGLLRLQPGRTFIPQGKGTWEGECVRLGGVLRGPDGGEEPVTLVVTRRTLGASARNESVYRAHYSTRPVLEVTGHGQMIPRDAHALARTLRRTLAITYTGGSR